MAYKETLYLVLILLLATSSYIRCEGDDEVDSDDAGKAEDVTENEEVVPVTEDSVLVLNSNNFDEVVNTNPTVLVEFYAPWCGHCKTLAPKYSAAAEELAKLDPPVVLAKVDATVHSELAQRFEVTGYPTLKFFKNGNQHDYDGPRDTSGIVEFMTKIADPKWEPEPESVVTLSTDNFDQVITKEKLLLVEFYAPWCGHCKQLAPIYEKAARQLLDIETPIVLAKVDATKESQIATRYNVTGYPTLKVFRSGKATEYRGERGSPYDIVSYMKSQIGDGAKEIKTSKELKEFFLPDDISVVGFFPSPEDARAVVYKDLSDDIRDDFNFGVVFDEAVLKAYKVKSNSVIVFTAERFHTKYEAKWYFLDVKDDTKADDILAFIKKHHLPLVGHYAPPRASHYDKKRPLCLVLYSVDFGFDHREATQFWRHKIADVAKKFPEITFAVADDEENEKVLKEFGLEESSEEINVALYGADGKKYPMEPMDEYDSEDFTDFLKKYKKGKLTAHIKSQKPPKKQTGAVTVVVGETFEKIVKDASKDVLIELYAPWCGHCKKLEPKYESLAKKLKKESNLVIAKLDATANDVPESYSSSGYPTIYFAASNNKDTPLAYEGPREVEDFEKFLKEHATVSFGKGQKEEL